MEQTLALYGMLRNKPRWFIRRRGLSWLKFGCCPCCYSSPPLTHCPVCWGSYRYGPLISEVRREYWRLTWEKLCKEAVL